MKKFITLWMIVIYLSAGQVSGTTTVSEVEKHLMCVCSCTMALYTCECETAGNMRTQIKAMIEKGMNRDQILASYVQQYGEKVLSAPGKRGFNLSAWILPLLLPLVIAFLLFHTIKRWSKPEKKSPINQEAEPAEDDLLRLQQELNRFEEGERS